MKSRLVLISTLSLMAMTATFDAQAQGTKRIRYTVTDLGVSGGNRVTVSMPYVGVPTLVKTLGAWVGKNLASGVVSAIGGKIFGAAMEALGLGDDKVQSMLSDISDRLTVVERTVSEIKLLCEEILHQLEALQLSMDQYFGEAFTDINAAYGRAPASPLGMQAPTVSVSTPTTHAAIREWLRAIFVYFCSSTKMAASLSLRGDRSFLTLPWRSES